MAAVVQRTGAGKWNKCCFTSGLGPSDHVAVWSLPKTVSLELVLDTPVRYVSFSTNFGLPVQISSFSESRAHVNSKIYPWDEQSINIKWTRAADTAWPMLVRQCSDSYWTDVQRSAVGFRDTLFHPKQSNFAPCFLTCNKKISFFLLFFSVSVASYVFDNIFCNAWKHH